MAFPHAVSVQMLLKAHISFNTLQRLQMGVENEWLNSLPTIINNTFLNCQNFTATPDQTNCGDSITVGGGL